MFSYIVDGKSHTDTSLEYLKKLGLDDDSIAAVIRDASEFYVTSQKNKEAYRRRLLDRTTDTILTHNEQKELGVTTDITDEQYRETLVFRESLRKM